MASPRLSDSQKQELVVRHRNGESAAALAKAFGCSPTTVSRVVKLAQHVETAVAQISAESAEMDGMVKEALADAPDGTADPAPLRQAPPRRVSPKPADPQDGLDGDQLEPQGSALAIDDADDFGEDGEEEELDLDEADEGLEDSMLPVIGSAARTNDLNPIQALPLTPGVLPSSLYMLVNKTVELEARPLSEFSELGLLPQEEQGRQALMLYVNPRQAKRQCGRNQRVIKLPDSSVLQRTAPYLVAQGITRLVLEGGNLFAIPGA